MIQLDDFICEAITSIVRGIMKGQESEDVGEFIAPLIQGKQRNDYGNFHLKDDETNQATVVQFEVSVGTTATSTEEGGAKAKARLFVVDLQAGGDKKGQTESSSLHKLRFAIPVTIPKRQ